MKRLFVLWFILIPIFLAIGAEAKSLKKGEVYRSSDGRTIEVVSNSELEIDVGGKTTYIQSRSATDATSRGVL